MIDVLDFARSSVRWTIPHDPADTRLPGHQPWGNSARILFDARCTVTDARAGRREEIFLVVPCRTEWMYRDDVLFQEPGGEYRALHSAARYRTIGHRLNEGPNPAPTLSRAAEAVFSAHDLVIRTIPAAPLATEAAVIAATLAGRPLLARTLVRDEASGVEVSLEYPIKTMNIHPGRGRFQVDTGPVLAPDFASAAEHWIDRLELAHIGYNTLDRAEFIARRPTPLAPDGPTVPHYGARRVHRARHTLLALD